MPWSDADDKEMLFGLIQLLGPKQADFEQVAAGMSTGVTATACSQRLRRMKQEFERAGNGKAKTPVKKAPTTAKKPGSGKRKAQKANEDGEQADQDDEEESPVKKPKTKETEETKTNSTKAESKPGEDDDDDDWMV